LSTNEPYDICLDNVLLNRESVRDSCGTA
jgi:hypothetical protein